MIKFFKNLYCEWKYQNSDRWCNICEIDDTDMKIIVYRLLETNHISFQIYDKVPQTNDQYLLRGTYTSNGDPKYAYMPGFTKKLECEDVDLDEIIKTNE